MVQKKVIWRRALKPCGFTGVLVVIISTTLFFQSLGADEVSQRFDLPEVIIESTQASYCVQKIEIRGPTVAIRNRLFEIFADKASVVRSGRTGSFTLAGTDFVEFTEFYAVLHSPCSETQTSGANI